jgi:putative transposase
MADSVTAPAVPKDDHHADRTVVRHGHGPGSVTLGGGAGAGSPAPGFGPWTAGEVPMAAYELFAGTDVLRRMVLERMLAGLSTHHYRRG